MLIILFGQLWNILGSKELFQQVHDTNGQYDAKSHLAEMIALLGPPPPKGIAREIKGHVGAQLAAACHERRWRTLQ
jgi:hypothetical protein